MLREAKGNMYDFITHTWNPIKGKCYHDCSYCYMKRWGAQKPLRLDERELKTDLGSGNFIFVGSSTDMFARDVETPMIESVLKKMSEYDNHYLLQTKDPDEFKHFFLIMPEKTSLCTTIETNRYYENIMGNAPHPLFRAMSMSWIKKFRKYITIEPIIDFDLDMFATVIKASNPAQVNIGADSGRNNLPEPPREKVLELISELEKFTKVVIKSNLHRIIGGNHG